MDRYFVYSSKYSVYNALTNNAILSKTLTLPQYRTNSIGFLSQDFIFITTDKLNFNARSSYDNSEANYPITLEVSGLEGSGVNVILLYEKDGEYLLSDSFIDIAEYPRTEDCRGAFLLGQIPFSCVKRIIFESVEEQEEFPNGSPDFWFPEDIYSSWESTEYSCLNVKSLNIEAFCSLCHEIETRLDSDCKEEMNSKVSKHLRLKAGAYYFIKGTENWTFDSGRLIGNVDGSLIALLDSFDPEQKYYHYAEERLKSISKVFSQISLDALKRIDSAFAVDIDTQSPYGLLRIISNSILECTAQDDSSFTNVFDRIIQDLKEPGNYNMFAAADITSAVDAIHAYYSAESFETPLDDVLHSIEDYPVLKALLIVSICPNDFDTLDRACIKLNQEERRYALLMFGLINSMPSVDGNQKCNRLLEKHIEYVISRINQAQDNLLVSVVDDEIGSSAYGITPRFSLQMGQEEFSRTILSETDDLCIKCLYDDLFSSDIPEDLVSRYSHPIEIIIRNPLNIHQEKAYPIDKPADIEKVLKTVRDVVQKRFTGRKTEFSPALFREKLSSDATLLDKAYSHYCKS